MMINYKCILFKKTSIADIRLSKTLITLLSILSSICYRYIQNAVAEGAIHDHARLKPVFGAQRIQRIERGDRLADAGRRQAFARA